MIKKMKGEKWYYKLLWGYFLVVLLSAVSFFTSPTASALGITGGQVLHYQSGAMIGFPSTVVLGQMNKSAEVLWYNFGDVNQWYGFDLRTVEEIPANSLVSFNITFTMTNDSGPVGSLSYNGLQFEDGRTLLFDSCQDASRNFTNYTTWTCSYLYYNPYATYYIQTRGGNHIIEVPQSSSVSVVRNVVIGTPSAIQLTNDGLSASDRAWLEQNLPSGTSTADIESAIESAREDEKTEYENQQSDVEGGADDAGDKAENETSTLIQTGRNIIETIRDTPATNCTIRIRTANFDTGNLNLCNVPQEIRTVISTVITIPVTLAALHIAYSVVMLYLTTVRKEQE